MKSTSFRVAVAVVGSVAVAVWLNLSRAHAEDEPQPSRGFMPVTPQVTRAHAEDEPQPSPEPEQITLFVGADAEPLELSVYQEAGLEAQVDAGDVDAGDVIVRYWGDGDVIALLQTLVPDFDLDDPTLRSVPLGIAPLSTVTTPDITLGAVAMITTRGDTTLLMGDKSGIIGVRMAGAVSTGFQPHVMEFFEGDLVSQTGCSATVGACTCWATGSLTHCGVEPDGKGTDWATCTDTQQVTRCWAKGGECECNTTRLVP